MYNVHFKAYWSSCEPCTLYVQYLYIDMQVHRYATVQNNL
jgi:hypothetical protein